MSAVLRAVGGYRGNRMKGFLIRLFRTEQFLIRAERPIDSKVAQKGLHPIALPRGLRCDATSAVPRAVRGYQCTLAK